MEFIHTTYQPGDTIAAVATPPGEGGVAIIRISGNRALEIASSIFDGPVHQYKSHTVHYGKVVCPLGKHIDDVLLIPMLGSRSYTGEDTVEICCHGGSLVTRQVLETILQAGARAAQPGEFTFKAFINDTRPSATDLDPVGIGALREIQSFVIVGNPRAFAEPQRQPPAGPGTSPPARRRSVCKARSRDRRRPRRFPRAPKRARSQSAIGSRTDRRRRHVSSLGIPISTAAPILPAGIRSQHHPK